MNNTTTRPREDLIPRITVMLNGPGSTEGREVYSRKWTPSSRLLQNTSSSTLNSNDKKSLNTPSTSPSKRVKASNTRLFNSPLLNGSSVNKKKVSQDLFTFSKNKENETNLFSSNLLRKSKPLSGSLHQLNDHKVEHLEKKSRSHSRDHKKNFEVKMNFAMNMGSTTEDSDSPKDILNTTNDLPKSNLSLHESSVQVAVRLRPFLMNEKESKDYDIMIRDKDVLVKHDGKRDNPLFTFDYVFDSSNVEKLNFYSQEKVFIKIGYQILNYALEGYNTCLFAYGQSGSGKTYTMMGTDSNPGIIPRLLRELFRHIDRKSDIDFTITINFLEIYQEKIYDLLVDDFTKASLKKKDNLRVREAPTLGAHVPDLTNYSVEDYESTLELLKLGNKHRKEASTQLNDHSSRSHAVFSILIVQKSSINPEANLVSKINLVDLAGSEKPSNNDITRFREGTIINKSLFTLGKVIDALSKGEKVVPYRESQLTFLLKDSLGGNSRTFMMATISPTKEHMEETISTLRYASTASKIVNIVHVNEDATTTYINTLLRQISVLKKQVKNRECLNDDEKVYIGEQTVPKRLWTRNSLDPSSSSSLSSSSSSLSTDSSSSTSSSSSSSEDAELIKKSAKKSHKECILPDYNQMEKLIAAFSELKDVVQKSFQFEVPSFETKTVGLLEELLNDLNSFDVSDATVDCEKVLKQVGVSASSDDDDTEDREKVFKKKLKRKKSKISFLKEAVSSDKKQSKSSSPSSSDSEDEEKSHDKRSKDKKEDKADEKSKLKNEAEKKDADSKKADDIFEKKKEKEKAEAEESDPEPPKNLNQKARKDWIKARENRKKQEAQEKKEKEKLKKESEEKEKLKKEKETKEENEKIKGQDFDSHPPASLKGKALKKWKKDHNECKKQEAEKKKEEKEVEAERKKKEKAEESDSETPEILKGKAKNDLLKNPEECKKKEAEKKKEEKEKDNEDDDNENSEEEEVLSDPEPPLGLTGKSLKKWKKDREERKRIEAEKKKEEKEKDNEDDDNENSEEEEVLSDPEPPLGLTGKSLKKWKKDREERKRIEAEKKEKEKEKDNEDDDNENSEEEEVLSDPEPPPGLKGKSLKKSVNGREERKRIEAEKKEKEKEKDNENEEKKKQESEAKSSEKNPWAKDHVNKKKKEKVDDTAEAVGDDPPLGLSKKEAEKWLKDQAERKKKEAEEKKKLDDEKNSEDSQESDTEPPNNLSQKQKKQWYKDREKKLAEKANENDNDAAESDTEPPNNLSKKQKKQMYEDREKKLAEKANENDNDAAESDTEPPNDLSKKQKKQWIKKRQERKEKEAEERKNKENQKDQTNDKSINKSDTSNDYQDAESGFEGKKTSNNKNKTSKKKKKK